MVRAISLLIILPKKNQLCGKNFGIIAAIVFFDVGVFPLNTYSFPESFFPYENIKILNKKFLKKYNGEKEQEGIFFLRNFRGIIHIYVLYIYI
jgi:hypothetical protein